MADWYGNARSNYFKVKDKAKFVQWASSLGGLEVIEDDEGRVGLLADSDFGGWPSSIENEETGDFDELDLLQEIAPHLQDGSVAVLFEVGPEKLRYLTGRAEAINAQGEIVTVCLRHIYEAAKVLGGEITLAEW